MMTDTQERDALSERCRLQVVAVGFDMTQAEIRVTRRCLREAADTLDADQLCFEKLCPELAAARKLAAEREEALQRVRDFLKATDIREDNRTFVLAMQMEAILGKEGSPVENTCESFEGYLRRRLGDNYTTIVIAALDSREDNATAAIIEAVDAHQAAKRGEEGSHTT